MFETSLLFPSQTPTQVSSQDQVNILQRVSALGWKKILIIGLSISGCLSTTVGTWYILANRSKQISSDLVPLVIADTPDPTPIYIDVSGAVEKPGVYQLAEGDRVAAAIVAAGGLSSRADSYYLNTSLNLSSKLEDEQKIYVPFEGEAAAVPTAGTTSVALVAATGSSSLISINSATENELDGLPRIGPATVEKIITGRPYAAIDELVTKKVVSEGVLAEIKALIKI